MIYYKNMQKTNIRLNNFFILENKGKYFLTDIDQLEDWKDFQSKKLKQFLKKDITEKVNGLLKEYKVSSNVNFIVDDFNNKLDGGHSPVKIIRLTEGGG
tara:strand:- start:487 stop:783 length:297 start_codon:yes stop_codon:yes gene_type:complete